jgi:flagellar biosynthetic protein FliR
MRLDAEFLLTFFAVFVRATAMLLVAPLIGQAVPVNVRVLLGAVISLALTPVVQPMIGELPTSTIELVLFAGREVLMGAVIGVTIQLVLSALQAAGALADLQMGIASAQLFNPMMGGASTPLAQFKFWLGLALIFLLQGHHMMFKAFMKSYEMGTRTAPDLITQMGDFVSFISQIAALALQISAPVFAVSFIIDVAAGFINKAVPQTQPFLLALPGKLAAGMLALAFGLPAIVLGVQTGLRVGFDALGQLFGGS